MAMVQVNDEVLHSHAFKIDEVDGLCHKFSESGKESLYRLERCLSMHQREIPTEMTTSSYWQHVQPYAVRVSLI